jgi:hypothetical protein
MLTMSPAAFAALMLNLGTSNPIQLLLIAEAAAMAVQQGVSPPPATSQEMYVAACGAVSASCGYPLGSYGAQDQSTIMSVVAGFMQNLRGLAAGPPTLQNPSSNTYQFRL